jgi:hypothetical protein
MSISLFSDRIDMIDKMILDSFLYYPRPAPPTCPDSSVAAGEMSAVNRGKSSKSCLPLARPDLSVADPDLSVGFVGGLKALLFHLSILQILPVGGSNSRDLSLTVVSYTHHRSSEKSAANFI